MNSTRISIWSACALALIGAALVYFSLISKYEYHTPQALWLFVLIPIMVIFYIARISKNQTKLSYSTLKGFEGIGSSWLGQARHLLFPLRIIALALLFMAAARPQSATSYENMTREGIDIVLAIDLSASMLSKDFKPNRLESSKEVAANFVSERPDDRIGVVVYEGESFTQVPLTSDHRVVLESINSLRTGMVEGGTAIGMGLATAVNRLKTSEARSKVIILLTDGVNNAGQIKPLDAARIAEAFDVRVYTIGVGSKGQAQTPVAMRNGKYIFEMRPVEIDEEVLQEIAKMTDGAYFRATSKKGLKEVYEQIDKLEKTKFNVNQYTQRTEEFGYIALMGLILLLIEFLFRQTILRTTL
ncbi:MAG: Ca-activated chloride channel family protein [Flavobacteriales bacterium]